MKVTIPVLTKTDNSKYAFYGVIIALVLSAVLQFFPSPTPIATEISETFSDNYYAFTPAIYEETSGQSRAKLLNFYADWCVSCSEMEPDIISVMSELGVKESIYGYRVNFGDNSEIPEGRALAEKYGIRTQSVVLVLTADDQVFDSFLTTAPREELRASLLAAATVSDTQRSAQIR